MTQPRDYAFQIIRAKDGVRSPVAFCSRERFAQVLSIDLLREHVLPTDYVIVMYEFAADGKAESGLFSLAPLMTVERFCNDFGSKTND